jgi:hypothetical protein
MTGKRAISQGFLLCALARGLAACSSDPGPALSPGDLPELEQDAEAATACESGALEDCDCPQGSGVRVCIDGGFEACQCSEPDDASAPQDPLSSCAPGHYEGTFEGWAGFVVATTPVTALDLSGMPGLVLDVERPSGGGEFLEVGNGFMKGNANGTFPFEASIEGRLDCSKREFTGEVKGSVQLVFDGLDNPFTGTMTAKYDDTKLSFVEGKWEVKGAAADGGIDFGLVGSGSWSAAHKDAAGDAGGP